MDDEIDKILEASLSAIETPMAVLPLIMSSESYFDWDLITKRQKI